MPNRKLEIGHRGWRTTRNAFGLLCILLLGAIGGCASGHRSADSASDKAVECIIREAKDVALKPVDLETAVQRAMGRCTAELLAEEKAWSAWMPGHREQTQEALRKLNAARLDQTRKMIADIRTQ